MEFTRTRTGFDLADCDFLKTIMMLAVILYHSICLWNGNGWHLMPRESSTILAFLCAFLNSIHVYVFTFVSGYLYFVLLTEHNRYGNQRQAILGRAKRLLVPYALMLLVTMPLVFALERQSLTMLLQKYILGIAPSQLWFLLMLFLVQTAFLLLGKRVYENVKFVLFLVLGVYCIGLLGEKITYDYFQIWTACRFALYFYLGGLFRIWQRATCARVPAVPAVLAEAALFGLYWLSKQQPGRLFTGIAEGLLFLCTLSGIAMALALTEAFAGTACYRRLTQKSIYRFFCKYSFPMFLLHEQLIYLSNFALNPILPTAVLALVNFVWAITASGFLSWLLGRGETTRRLFGISNQSVCATQTP